MPRPVVANSGGGVQGGLVGAVLTNGKQPLEEALALEAQRRGWSTRAVHWLTKRELEVAVQRGNQPLYVLRVKVGPEAMTKEALDDEIYNQFCRQLSSIEV